MVDIDMSEYGENILWLVYWLVPSPGYIGSEEGAILDEAISSRNRISVISP